MRYNATAIATELEKNMSDQLTVRLPDKLSRSLAEAAIRLRRKRSEVVRLALESFLEPPARERGATRVASLLGSLESGEPHLAERHREAVLESLRRGR